MNDAAMDGNPLKRVLILDDDRKLRDIMSRIVRRLGMEPFSTDDGRAAIHEHSERRFSAMFVDLLMPKMRGEEFILEARQVNGSPDRPLVVVMTGLQDVTLAGLDVDGVILKPFGVREVAKVLEEI